MSQGANLGPSPPVGEGGARAEGVGGRGVSKLLSHAKAMRSKPTEAERRLWSLLRGKRPAAFKFKRQQPIGPFIADFVNFEHRLIIEADGSQHIENESDAKRTAWLEGQGFTVLRSWNNDILTRTETVTDAIWAALHARPLPPTASRRVPPSPARGEGLEGALPHD